jgi:hypothetical protein
MHVCWQTGLYPVYDSTPQREGALRLAGWPALGDAEALEVRRAGSEAGGGVGRSCRGARRQAFVVSLEDAGATPRAVVRAAACPFGV